MVLHLKKLESLSSKDTCAKIDWNWPNGHGEEDFLISSMYFRCFIIISPWKRVVQYSQRGSRITPRSRGGVIILPALACRGDSSPGFAGRSAVDYLLGKLPVQWSMIQVTVIDSDFLRVQLISSYYTFCKKIWLTW